MAEMASEDRGNAGPGKAFFDRADEVAETGNWDFAIELYLEGIRREPGNVSHGHQHLREVALRRKLQGGKPAGMVEQIKRRDGKDPLENLINAEYLLAKDPGSISLMERVVKAAMALGLPEVAEWMCHILLESQRTAAKPRRRVLMLLIDVYTQLEDYALAIQACEMARKMAPDDPSLEEIFSDLSAKFAIKRGRYDEEGDFTKSVRDLEKQKELIQKDAEIQQESFLQSQVDKARSEYLQAPTEPGKVMALVDALVKFEKEPQENEAVEVLEKAYRETGTYQFKARIGDIRMRQMGRRIRQAKAEGNEEALETLRKEKLEFELAEFAERARNYPTDLSIKFELGRRHFQAGNYDEAIALFQQSQRDKRRQAQSMYYLGQAFAVKGWLPEAAETYRRALELELTEDQEKEMRYNLGDILQQQGKLEEALEQFSKIAQMEFTYRDVRDRVEGIRAKLAGDSPQGG